MSLPRLAGLVLCGGIAALALPASESTRAGAGPGVDKVLLHHGWDVPSPRDVLENAALIDQRPFDGITVNLPGLSSTTLGPHLHALEEYEQALAPLPRLERVTQNLVVVRVQDAFPDDFADDRAWTAAASNMENLALAARGRGGLVGVLLDTEHYGNGENPWDYGRSTSAWTPAAVEGALPGRTPEQAAAVVESRGRSVGHALFGSWPDAVLLTTYGPWVSDPATAEKGFRGFRYDDVSWANELMGSFLGGLARAAGQSPRATFIDGGELYQLRRAEEFRRAYRWMKEGVAVSVTSPVPHELVAQWPDRVSVAFGVGDVADGAADADDWQDRLSLALAHADGWVWAYSERYDWLGTGWPEDRVPEPWVTATRRARR